MIGISNIDINVIKAHVERDKDEFKRLIDDTRACLQKGKCHPLDCERIHSRIQDSTYPFTFHTHPDSTRYSIIPSEADIISARKLKKDVVCIGIPDRREIRCYDVNKHLLLVKKL